MEGGPTPFREAVLQAFDAWVTDNVAAPSNSVARTLVAVFCSDDQRWGQLQEMASVAETATLAIVPDLDFDSYVRALSLGADGVTHADTTSQIIASVAGAACRGETVVPTFVAHKLARHVMGRQVTHELTSYDVELLQLLADGRSIPALASHFSYGERSIRRHLHSLYLKIGVPNRTAAIRYAAVHLPPVAAPDAG